MFWRGAAKVRREGQLRRERKDGWVGLTSCLDKRRIMLLGQKWVRQIPEELFEKARYTIDVVEEVLGVSKVKLWRLRIYIPS